MKGNGATMVDPREAGLKPPFGGQRETAPPGLERQMMPDADHGEETYLGSGLLKDMSALITGADSGIGRAVALAFAREGADVAVSYLNEEEDAALTERWIQDAGRRTLRLPGDLSSEDHCETLVRRTVAEFGKIDILVNNAAYQVIHQQVEEFSTEEFDRVFRTNVYALFHLCKAALRHMRPGGSILNTTSIQAFEPKGILLPYAASKSAIAGFTRALAQLAVQRGVRVNAVAPGPVWTPLIPSTAPREFVEKFGADTVFGRPAQPAEVAPVYVFLASKYASYITGEVYGVTGGKMPL